MEKINKTKSCFSKKVKIDKPLVRLTKKKRDPNKQNKKERRGGSLKN